MGDQEIHVTTNLTEVGNRFIAHRMVVRLLWDFWRMQNEKEGEIIKKACLEAAEKAESAKPGNHFSDEMRQIFESLDLSQGPKLSVIEGGKTQQSPDESPH
jgi:hypothetical protein